jgi:hypothetical protein
VAQAKKAEAKEEQFEVMISNGLRMDYWADLGGVPGPMSKKKAESYARELTNAIGNTTKVVKFRG